MINLRRRLAGLGCVALLPFGATAVAAEVPAASYRVEATIPLDQPEGIASGFGAVWVLTGLEQESYSYLCRIDPATNTVTASYPVGGSAGGGPAIGFGSIWVSLYDANLVVRIDPTTGAVLARIHVALQPESVHVAFGSVWAGGHHGQRVSRIDPTTDTVIARPVVGDKHAYRDGPQDITDDGHVLYASASIDDSLDTIDPATSRVTNRWRTGVDQMCGDLVPAAGTVWSVDQCSNALYRLDPVHRAIRTFTPDTGEVKSATTFGHQLWVAFDRDADNSADAVLQARDPQNGAVRATLDIGGDALEVRGLYGNLWVLDPTAGTVRRISVS